jgi:RNA recognition motif-containing protein
VADEKENADGTEDAEKPLKAKNKKKKRTQRKTDQPARIDLSEEHGEPSKTTLFVGNLPFSTDDDGLKDILKNYRVKSAHVVKRKT